MQAIRQRVRQVSRKAVHRLNSTLPDVELQAKEISCAQQGDLVHQRLPDDIIYEIAQYLDTGHIYKLLLLNRSLYEIVSPLLWSTIDTRASVNPEKQIDELNKALKLKPEKALLVKEWVIGVQVITLAEHSKLHATTADIVVELAKKKCLVNLKRFWWFWRKGAPEEVWTALYSHCPLLKDIGVRHGPDDLVINPDSSFLKFRDLVGFHLTTHGVYRYHHPNQVRAAVGTTRIPTGLYEMLVEHSPRLRELTFDGSCPQQSLWDVWPILEATWPELHSLSLGMIRDLTKGRPPNEDASVVINFMARHKQLRELRFLGAAHWANHETVCSIASHENLTTFWGRYTQLKAATNLPCLRSVYLTDLFMDSANYSGILGRFGAITTLGLIVDVQQGMVRSMCQSIFEACPMLVHFDLRLRHGLTSYADIAEISQKTVHLRSLTLAGAHNLMDRGVIFTKGLTVVRRNPRLESFGLYFGEQFTRAGVSGVMTDRYAYGEFTVLRDRPGGRPTRLLVKEVRRGIGNFSRRYVKEITEDLLAPTNLPHTALFSHGETSSLYLPEK